MRGVGLMGRTYRRLLAASVAVALALACAAPAGALTTQALDASGPAAPVRLVFIHHSTGQSWLDDGNGGLGIALKNAGYYVSDTNYGWGPDGIGNNTDVGHWWTWFRGPKASTYTAALYADSDDTCGFSRMATNPGGPNEVVMFKSCFPNSAVYGSPSDAVPAIGSNPLKGGSGPLTVGNAKGVYLDLLEYFKLHPEKLFVLIVSPPLRAADTNASCAANARYLANWLTDPNGWLKGYPLRNVVAFDYYTVLTGGRHTVSAGAIVHTAGASNYLAYPTGDSHPSATGQRRAATDFVPFLNAVYHTWKGDAGLTPPVCLPAAPLATGTLFAAAGSCTPAHAGVWAVTVEVQRWDGTAWRAVRGGRARARAGRSRYAAHLVAGTAGSYRMRAVHTCDVHATTVSGWSAFTVR